MFVKSRMTLGRYGTALWIDSDTKFDGPSERGQRVAGRVVRDCGVAGINGYGNTVWEPDAQSCGASMVFAVQDDDDGWTRVAMEEAAGRIALGHSDGAITLLEY